MKRRFFIPLMLLGFSLSAGAQSLTNMSLTEFYSEYRTVKLRDKNATSEIAGTPYENDDFVPGEIVTTNLQRYSGIPLRLNNYSNQMEFTNENGDIYDIGAPETIEFIKIGEEKYVYSPYASGNKVMKGYFKVLAEGDVILLQKKNVMLKPAELPQGYKDAVPATFVKNQDEFFIRILPAEAKQFDNRKQLAELLPSFSADLETFIKKNKTRFSKSSDLKELIDYYNSLGK